MASVSIERVHKSYGQIGVLHGVTLEIADGEFVVLVGPSGCGKSTLLRMIAGLEEINAGDIRIGDRVVNNVAPKDRDVAMVFQNYALYPHMSVSSNMGFSMELRRVAQSMIDSAVARAAGTLGLAELLTRRPKELSGGQRQRVAMGRAIVREPQVFLFDEPLSNLNAKLRVQMRTEIKSLHQRLKNTVIYVTHDQIEAMTMADKVVLMSEGRIEQVGEPLSLYDRPQNVFAAGFIGSPAMNFVDCSYSRAEGGLLTKGGHRIPFADRNELADGAYLIGFRPEHISLGNGQRSPGLPGVVDVVEPTGAEVHIVVEYDGQQVQIVTRERSAVAHGDAVTVTVPEHAIHVFDQKSGARVDAMAVLRH